MNTLPPLPEADGEITIRGLTLDAFSASTLEAYALEAIAAQAQPAPIVVQPEPVLHQVRMRRTWIEDDKGWSDWSDCSEISHNDLATVPIHGESRYEVRALYLAAPAVLAVQPTPLGVPLLVVAGLAHFFELNGKLDEPVMEACRRLGDLVMPTATLLDDEAARKTILDAVNFMIAHFAPIGAPAIDQTKGTTP